MAPISGMRPTHQPAAIHANHFLSFSQYFSGRVSHSVTKIHIHVKFAKYVHDLDQPYQCINNLIIYKISIPATSLTGHLTEVLLKLGPTTVRTTLCSPDSLSHQPFPNTHKVY